MRTEKILILPSQSQFLSGRSRGKFLARPLFYLPHTRSFSQLERREVHRGEEEGITWRIGQCYRHFGPYLPSVREMRDDGVAERETRRNLPSEIDRAHQCSLIPAAFG